MHKWREKQQAKYQRGPAGEPQPILPPTAAPQGDSAVSLAALIPAGEREAVPAADGSDELWLRAG